MAILRKWQIWKKFIYYNKVWKKLEQDDKRGMSIIVGLTKITYFAKPANLARIETIETTKQSYWQLAIFTKMANLRKWGIEQESTHDLVKPQMRWQRWEDWQKANFDKYGECAKNASRVWPNIQMRWQKGACW